MRKWASAKLNGRNAVLRRRLEEMESKFLIFTLPASPWAYGQRFFLRCATIRAILRSSVGNNASDEPPSKRMNMQWFSCDYQSRTAARMNPVQTVMPTPKQQW